MLFFNSIKNYLLLGNLAVFLENVVKIFLHKATYNLNMLSMYIVYILNQLVIQIKNIFNTIISVVSLAITGTETILIKIEDKEVSELL